MPSYISIMHISTFLIAVISTAAIAKPLPDAQAGSPSGYFPSDFGAQGWLFTPFRSPGEKYLLLFSFSAHSNIFQKSSIMRLNSWDPQYSGLTMAIPYLTVTIRPLIRTALKLVIRLLSRATMTVETRLLSRTALPKGIPKATVQQRSIPRELVQHSDISENSGVALSRAANRASAAWETNMEILDPFQANWRVKKYIVAPSSNPPLCPPQFPITRYNRLNSLT